MIKKTYAIVRASTSAAILVAGLVVAGCRPTSASPPASASPTSSSSASPAASGSPAQASGVPGKTDIQRVMARTVEVADPHEHTVTGLPAITRLAAGSGRFLVTYMHYAARDPACCASLPPVTVGYIWAGGQRFTPSGGTRPEYGDPVRVRLTS